VRARRPGWAGHGDLAASLALVFPLMLAYGVLAAITMRVHVADLPSRVLWWACDRQRQRYLVAYAAIALGFVAWLRRHRRADALALRVVAPVVVEAAIYAFTLATVVWMAVARLPLGSDAVIGALGAGVHEELVFRLLGVAGGAALLRRLGVAPRVALGAAIVVAAVGFAAAHHLDAPWEARAFGFRTVAGVGFALVFWHRSLAHAVYAHVLYDLWIAAVAP
jgi:hypothetical protein